MDLLCFLIPTLILLVWICCSQAQPAVNNTCDKGWFGYDCRKKCHCGNDQCSATSGHCPTGERCKPPWFGPACQYRDLLHSDWKVPLFLRDHDDHTCNTQPGDSLLIHANILIGWFRIVTRDPQSVAEIEMEFFDDILCEGMKSVLFNSVTRDINCTNREFTNGIVLRGQGVPNLCSLYISIGRNVALKQKTQQTGVYIGNFGQYGSQNGVDGMIAGAHNYRSGYCVHTQTYKVSQYATWTLTFNDRLYLVNRIVIYNRMDQGLGVRMQNAVLEMLDENSESIWRYTTPKYSFKDIYVIDHAERKAVKKIRLQGRHKFNSKEYILNFCEMEVYGESVCAPYWHGLDCGVNCTDCDRHDCLVTGKCATCAKGIKGFSCTEVCDRGTYGDDCSQRCHKHCYRNDCQEADGTCWKCIIGFNGRHCERKCWVGYFGQGCTQRCSRTCMDRNCHHIHGTCSACADGYLGTLCDQTCDNGTYGTNCSNKCSSKCYQGQCSYVDGSCNACLPGHSGTFCDQKCDKGTFGVGCRKKCPRTCNSNDCRQNGTCFSCKLGYSGQHCDHATALIYLQRAELYYILLALVVLAICCVLLWKYRSGKQTDDEGQQLSSSSSTARTVS